MLSIIKSAIKSKYKSFDFPDFSFMSNEPMEIQSIKRLLTERSFFINDTSDPNDDVSSILSITLKDKSWLLLISWVGPFFNLVTLNGDSRSLCMAKNEHLSSDEKYIIESFAKFGYLNVPSHLLFENIEMAINGEDLEEVEIYKTIYTTTDIFSWMK